VPPNIVPYLHIIVNKNKQYTKQCIPLLVMVLLLKQLCDSVSADGNRRIADSTLSTAETTVAEWNGQVRLVWHFSITSKTDKSVRCVISRPLLKQTSTDKSVWCDISRPCRSHETNIQNETSENIQNSSDIEPLKRAHLITSMSGSKVTRRTAKQAT